MQPTITIINDQQNINSDAELIKVSLSSAFNMKVLTIGCDDAIKAKLTDGGFELASVSNIHEAKKCIYNTNDNPLFDAIICNDLIGEKSILHFAGYLSSTKSLSAIPFILFVSDNRFNSDICTQSQGIDDLITLETSLSDLSDKIWILKKYKSLKNSMPYSISAEETSGVNKQFILKRIIDIVISGLALIILSPLILLIAICIKLESKGPVFYKSLRAGTGYKVFTFFKFRTMVVNAEDMVKDLKHLNEYKGYQNNYFFKIKDDPRVTKVGQFLRKTSLDEIPQLINVLIGDMSLVGNRPLPLYEASAITVDKSAKRFLAPAGITGLWQVKGRSNVDLSVDERINMDLDYADKQSLLLDMKILLKTPKELILKNNV